MGPDKRRVRFERTGGTGIAAPRTSTAAAVAFVHSANAAYRDTAKECIR